MSKSSRDQRKGDAPENAGAPSSMPNAPEANDRRYPDPIEPPGIDPAEAPGRHGPQSPSKAE